MNFLKKLAFVICMVIILDSLFMTQVVDAAIFYFSPPHINIKTNGEAEVFLMLDTEGERINAIEGRVIFSKDKLSLVDIRYTDSVINLWIEDPSLEKAGEIIFAGIIPGGFDGVRDPFQKEIESGKILTLVFKAKSVGDGSIILENTRALLNDGKGTETDVSLIPFSVDISGEAVSDKTIGFIYGIIIISGLLFIYILWRRKKY
ncbi:MAG: hypothetical protein KAR00_00510 [Candidatus Pacebacteria bacterium]|nr:hypothetical protein [Candidatus Paceibacterota bacterium]